MMSKALANRENNAFDNNIGVMPYGYYGYTTVGEFNRAIMNHNPKRDRANAIAREVRTRRPEMQVRKIL